MTIIVSTIKDKEVFIGCDSAASSSLQMVTLARPKFISLTVGKQQRPLLVGIAGSMRVAQIVEGMPPPKHLKDARQFVISFAEAVRERIKLFGAVVEEQGSQFGEFEMLVIYSGQMFIIQSDFAVVETDSEVAAIGSGAAYALGSFWATAGLGQTPEQRVLTALAAAVKYDPYCERPFHTHKVRCDD